MSRPLVFGTSAIVALAFSACMFSQFIQARSALTFPPSLLAASALQQIGVAIPRFSVTQLPTLPLFGNCWAVGGSRSGAILGWAFGGFGAHAGGRPFLIKAGMVIPLALPPVDPSLVVTPLAINAKDLVVGVLGEGQKRPRAFLGTADHGQYLFSGEVYSRASAVNDAGQIVGRVQHASGDAMRGIIYDSISQKVTDLGPDIDPIAINNRGQVTGQMTGRHGGKLFLYDIEKATVLPVPQQCGVVGYAINDSGTVVGTAYVAGSGHRAFIFRHGAIQMLPILGGAGEAVALAVNGRDQVVGYADSKEGRRGFLYANGVLIDLNSAIARDSEWVLMEARAINDNGDIVGMGSAAGYSQGFLLRPIN
jgi:probable HAF family extracellular repeat protein